MSISFKYTSWEKEDNFELVTGEYHSLEQFVELIKSSEHQINQRLTQILEKRGDLIPGTAKAKLNNVGQEGSKKVNQENEEIK